MARALTTSIDSKCVMGGVLLPFNINMLSWEVLAFEVLDPVRISILVATTLLEVSLSFYGILLTYD